MNRFAGPGAAHSRPSHARTWSDRLYPATDAERRAHSRMSFRRTLAALAIVWAALGGIIGLVAACTAL